ncbi:hypothetical protein [Streptosporangium sp. NPDC000396]|uniref:hypothetical protein n=1 Tax=Streptosporangium sp. NPDC000396 TaxID=3366185 RepID=UPI0036906E90
MSIVNHGPAEDSIEEESAEGRLTFQQVHDMVKGMGAAGVINLNATLKNLLDPVDQVLGYEVGPSPRLVIFIIDHYWVAGPNPPQ